MTLLLVLTLLAAAGDPTFHQLRADWAEASSFLKSNWNKYNENYHPSYVLDGDPATAWVEGVDGHGEGQTLRIPLSALKSANTIKLRIRNGYQKSEQLFGANAVPKDVVVRVLDRSGGTVLSANHTLEKTMGWQDIVLPLPGQRGLAGVELEVVSVYEGRTYQDTCISDVEVFVDSDVPYQANVEQGKHAILQGLVTARVAQAKYFADLPAEYPFAFTNYQSSEREGVVLADLEAQLAPLAARLEEVKAQGAWYRGAVTKEVPPPDGAAADFTDLLDLFDAGNVALFETNTELAAHEKLEFDEAKQIWGDEESWRSNYRVVWADADKTKPRELYFWRKRTVEERGTYTSEGHYLVQFDDEGKLVSYFRSGTHTDDMEPGPSAGSQHVAFVRDAKGKITGWTSSEVGDGFDYEAQKMRRTAVVRTYAGADS